MMMMLKGNDSNLDWGKFTKQSESMAAEHGHSEVHPFDHHDNDHDDDDHDDENVDHDYDGEDKSLFLGLFL